MSAFRFHKKNKEIEPHEVFLDELVQKREREYGTSKKRIEVPLPRNTLILFSLIFFLLFLLFFARDVQLQILENEHYTALAQRNVLSISSKQITRGIIYDRTGRQIVYNVPQYDLYFNSRQISSAEKSAINEVGQILEISPTELLKKIKDSSNNLVEIRRELPHEKLILLQPQIDDLSGFYLLNSIGRDYTTPISASHIIGYIGKIDKGMLSKHPEKYAIHDYVGKMGVEKFYEEYLTRRGDQTKIKRDAQGNIISAETVEDESIGTNIILTIDLELQEIAEEKIKERLEQFNVDSAGVVALNPHTGEILTMASVPGFDNNLFRKNTDQNLLAELFQNTEGIFINRLISSTYPTGSIIKPLLAVAALEEGIISPEKRIHSPGYISIPNPWNPLEPTIFRDYQAHGWRDMREAIAVSSNVYFYAIGGGYEDQIGLGASKIGEYLSLFGWNEKTGVDLFSEKDGFIPDSEWKKETLNDLWRVGDTYNLSIGQGFLSTTPLQVAVSYASIINGGEIITPYILKKIVDDNGDVVKENVPNISRKLPFSPENLKIAKEGMGLATKIGTGRPLQSLPVSSGAKTGTAQTSRAGLNNSWIGAFAPYEDPEILIVAVVEDVRGITPVATHIANDILQAYFTLEEKKEEDGDIKKKEDENN